MWFAESQIQLHEVEYRKDMDKGRKHEVKRQWLGLG
jgi:hypothetical protein